MNEEAVKTDIFGMRTFFSFGMDWDTCVFLYSFEHYEIEPCKGNERC